jgi:hypothetical protein
MNTFKAQPNLPIALFILILLLIAAIFLPFGYGLDLGPGPNRIRALVWEYLDAPWFSGVRFVQTGQVLEAIASTLPTYFFLFQIFTSYRKGSEQKYLVHVGILGAIFPALVSLIQIIGWLQGWTQPPPPVSDHRFPIYIPIPSVYFLSLILVRILPVGNRNEKESG